MPVRGFHPLRPDFPARSGSSLAALKRSYYPGRASTLPVWALSLSIATTQDIDVSFFSCRYLDVSVPCVRPGYSPVSGLQPDGLPHSESSGSLPVCSSPEIFAAYHVLLRLQKPRHPPSALISFFSSTRTALLWPRSIPAPLPISARHCEIVLLRPILLLPRYLFPILSNNFPEPLPAVPMPYLAKRQERLLTRKVLFLRRNSACQTPKRRCSSHTFRYGYLVTT